MGLAGTGDVNRDGKVDASDIEAIVRHIMGKTPEGFDVGAADVNGDGRVNVADVVFLLAQPEEESDIPINLNGQEQVGNGSNAHLNNVLNNYLSTLHLIIDVPLEYRGKFNAIVLETDGQLTTEANLSVPSGSTEIVTSMSTIVMSLEDVFSTNQQSALDIYISMMPTDLTERQLKVMVYDAEGNVFKVAGDYGGRKYQAGQMYDLTGTLNSKSECKGLPVVIVNTPDGEEISSKDTWLTGTSLTVLDTDGSFVNAPGKVKGRGNNTWVQPKKPYTLKFSKKQRPFGLPANKDWVLLADYYDPTLLRTAFMSAVSKAAGIDFTINYKHVNLFLNGDYMGVYLLTDKVEESSNRINIEKDGFIIEDDNYYLYEKLYFIISLFKAGYTFKYPDDDEDIVKDDDNYLFIQKYMNDVESSLYKLKDNPADESYLTYIDPVSFAKFQVAVASILMFDPNRYYVLPSRQSKLKMMPLWDAEWSLGLKRSAWGGSTTSLETSKYWDRQFFFQYLMKSPAFVETLKSEWAKFKQNIPQVKDEIEQVRQTVSKAQEDNYKKWPVKKSALNISFDTWEQEVEYILKFFDDRIRWLDEHYATM